MKGLHWLPRINNQASTLPALIEARAREKKRSIAIISEEGTLSYRDLNQKANQLAHYLISLQLKQESLIGIALPRSAQLLIAVLGILKAGHAYLPLDEHYPPERLSFILEDSKAPLVITEASLSSALNQYQGKMLSLEKMNLDKYSKLNPKLSIDARQLVYLIYTSGSTGQPKGVCIEHKSLVNYIEWFKDYSQCQEQQRVDFSSHFIFDIAVTTSVAALALGLQVIICPETTKHDVVSYLQHLQKNCIQLIKVTPSYFKLMIEEAHRQTIGLPDLKHIIIGGENLLQSDCAQWLYLYPHHQLFNEYGPTEATVAISQFKITKDNLETFGESAPIGKAGSNMACLLLDEHQQPVPALEAGELYLGGEGLARGYLNRADLSAQRFIHLPNHGEQRWYKTGDWCRMLSDGNLEFIERIDDQVKWHGYRIELGEITNALRSHPLLKDAIVLIQETQYQEQQLAAYYIPLDKNTLPAHRDLRHFLKQRLMDYMIPTCFIGLDQFPLTTNGKLDKKALLLALPNTSPQSKGDYQAIENKLTSICADVFHLHTIKTEAHFFELGGHSLTAARLLHKIEQEFNKKLLIEDIYNYPSIKELAPIIAQAEKMDETHANDLIPPHSQKKHTPLSDFQFVLWLSSFFEPKAKRLNIIMRRRLNDQLDVQALTQAFQHVLQGHEIFSYRIGKFFPVQYKKKYWQFKLIENDLQHDSPAEQESLLTASLNELIRHYPWKPKEPLLLARLFYLDATSSELQICLPHIIFDDASEDILLTELSNAYLFYKKKLNTEPPKPKIEYKHFVQHEQRHLNQQFSEDIQYWENYLQDASLLKLPHSEVIHHPQEKNYTYSTYLEFPNELLDNILTQCSLYRMNFIDMLGASIRLCLQRLSADLNPNKLFFNIVRSTRDEDQFDKIMGCLIRLDPIKVDIHGSMDLVQAAKNIQQERFDTETHQACSSMAKLASLDKTHLKRPIKTKLCKSLSSAYAKVCGIHLDPSMLAMYGRLSDIKKEQRFLVNINILTNLLHPKPNKQLFGQDILATRLHQYNVSTTHQLLDICLLRNWSTDQAYLIISANVRESFRHEIGYQIVQALGAL